MTSRFQIADKDVINVDQTPIWLNVSLTGMKTVDQKGIQKVTTLRPEGNHREKVSVILACSKDGGKLAPALVVKSTTN
jgi:hypothetical protein